jgi:predicted nucleotidyltransferase
MGLKPFLEDSLGVKVDLVTRAALKPQLRCWETSCGSSMEAR